MQAGVSRNIGLFGFQHDGADWLSGRRFAYLADEQRVGKTGQLIRAADQACAVGVCITCPASAVGVWEQAIPRWSAGLWRYRIGSYDRHSDHGLPGGACVYIFDEAHRLKNLKAQRTRNLLGPLSPIFKARHVWAASGTPAPNNPAELFPWLSAFGLWTEGYAAFLKRFFRYKRDAYGEYQVIGVKPDRAAELRALWATVHLRRLRKDVMPYEQEPLRDEIILHVSDVASDAQLAQQLYSIQLQPGDLPDENDEHFATICRLIGEAKAGPLAKFIADELDDGEGKVAIFYWHKTVGDIFAAELARYGVARVDGSVPAGPKRQAQADRFSRELSCRVFLGQIMAAGEAIDLAENCSSMVMAERSWTPGQNGQAEARLSGHLQSQRVLIRTAILRGTLDDGQTHVLARKAKNLSHLN